MDHVGITVPDLDEAIVFFTEVMGARTAVAQARSVDPAGHAFPQTLRISPRSHGAPGAAALRPGLNLELLEYRAPHQRRGIPANSDVDVAHLCFFVEDMAAAAAYLAAHGCHLLAGPSTNHGPNEGEQYRYFLSAVGHVAGNCPPPGSPALRARTTPPVWSGTRLALANMPFF
ncbi:MAG: VOC family protein [Hymenobacter sp.]